MGIKEFKRGDFVWVSICDKTKIVIESDWQAEEARSHNTSLTRMKVQIVGIWPSGRYYLVRIPLEISGSRAENWSTSYGVTGDLLREHVTRVTEQYMIPVKNPCLTCRLGYGG